MCGPEGLAGVEHRRIAEHRDDACHEQQRPDDEKNRVEEEQCRALAPETNNKITSQHPFQAG